MSAVAMALATLAAAPIAQAIAIVATARIRNMDGLLLCIIEKFLTAFDSAKERVSAESAIVAVSRRGEAG